MPTTIRCPDCGAAMVLRETRRFAYRNGEPRRFYGCSRWPACRATHGAHPDGRPLGVPANRQTKLSRIRCHEALDVLWKDLGLSRDEAYAVLADLMGLPRDHCHIGSFTITQCEDAIAFLQAYVRETYQCLR